MGLGIAFGAQAQIDHDDILYWVGNGDAHAIVAISWDAEEVGLAWGVNYDSEMGLTVHDALDSIKQYDPRFNYSFSIYGDYTVMGFSSLTFDFDGEEVGIANTETPCVWMEDNLLSSPQDEEWDYEFIENEDGIILISTGCYQDYSNIVPVDPPTDPVEPATDALIDFADILYWVGEGNDSAALIVNFGIPDTAFAWGYKFNGTATVQQMTDAITAADPRFWVDSLPSYYPDGDIFFITDEGDTLSLSGRDSLNPYNYWEANINGQVSYSGAEQVLTNGDIFKYGDQRAPSRVCLSEYSGWCLQSAYTKVPTPVNVPTTTDTTEVLADATVDFADITCWAGSGPDSTALIVSFANPDTAFAWGVLINGQTTSEAMLNAVLAVDTNLSITGHPDWGDGQIHYRLSDGTIISRTGTEWIFNIDGVDAWGDDEVSAGSVFKFGDRASGILVGDDAFQRVWTAIPTIVDFCSGDTASTDTTVAVVDASIAASDILYWVGEGSNEVVFAVNWADTALAWGYRFGADSTTVAEVMDSLCAADWRLSYTPSSWGLDNIVFFDSIDSIANPTGGNWMSTLNGNSAASMGMGTVLHDGDFFKWGDYLIGTLTDPVNFIMVFTDSIYAVSVPAHHTDTTTTDTTSTEPEHGPFCGAVGTEGCNAIAQDSSAIVAWATGVELTRGPQMISNPNSPMASFGTDSNAIGQATASNTMAAVSLGDGGSALITFEHPIRNGEGPDFAVFENSFGDSFLELAFVEVSTDGERFVRFPATSLTQTQTQTGETGSTDPTKINNLAGKFRIGYGTPFDLAELADSTGIDIDSIVYVRLVDVVGSIDPQYASYDAFGHIVNDPWPTNFAACGFDLTGVAVMYERDDVVPVAVDATIAASDIRYWIGEGSNEVILAVNWVDTALAWGYRFAGESTTVQEVMDAIAAADSRFSYSGEGWLDDIVFAENGTSHQAQQAGWWMSTLNGSSAASEGMTTVLHSGDLFKWGDYAAGTTVDTVTYAMVFTDEIYPASDPNAGIEASEDVVLGLYPNPATSIVNVIAKAETEAILFDMAGRSVMSVTLREGRNTLDLSSLQNGIYMLRTAGHVEKIIKK